MDSINDSKQSSAVSRRRMSLNTMSSRRGDIWRCSNCSNLLLITIVLCATKSIALIFPSHHRSAISSAHRRQCAYLPPGIGSFHRLSSTRQVRLKHSLLYAEKKAQESYEEDDIKYDNGGDKNVDSEDNIDTDEYLEHLITNAMKEEELRNDQRQRKTPSKSTTDNDSALEETKRMMEQQQQQIDLLMKLINQGKNQQSAPSAATKQEKTVNVTPLKIMFFIDGTWLYYSLHARKKESCVVSQKFGRGWQADYKVDWSVLPRLICNEIEKQRGGHKSFKGSNRPLDIARVSVFTSAKKETDPNSIRMRMFRDMANANYDVHMMETVGKGEKCVDIQLAVEMLHYATVPNAFDMAVILTGDKDFVPALVRTRQKGKEVVICSMKSGCNKVLYTSPHIRDYNVVWLENILDDLIIPIPENERGKLKRADYASAFTMMRVIRDYVEAAPEDIEFVSSRDVGRYLKSVKIADSDMLDELKQSHGGLWNFLTERAKHLFAIETPSDLGQAADHSFGIRVRPGSDDILVDEFKRTQYFTQEEKEFLEHYSKPTDVLYSHTEYTNEDDSDSADETEPMPEYSKMTVATLKEICKEKNIPVSGKKKDLVERLEECYWEYNKLVQAAAQKKRKEWKEAHRKTIARINSPTNVYSNSLPQLDVRQTKKTLGDDPKVAAHLEALIKEYLTASGGVASSRDIGRYLSANSDSRNLHKSALAELKEAYGSLLTFLHSRSAFEVDNTVPEIQYRTDGFPIKLTTLKT